MYDKGIMVGGILGGKYKFLGKKKTAGL